LTVDSTPGVVLKGFDIGESDVVVELYTVRWGRVHAVAKGGRRSKRRFVNKLEPFSYLRLLLAGRERGLMRLQEADIIRPFFHLTEDLRRILYAFHALELVRVMTPLWDPHPEVMGLLVRFLSFVDEGGAREEHLRLLELRLLSLMGYRPRFDRCLACGARLDGGGTFLFAKGGVVCRDCRGAEAEGVALSGGTLRVLGQALRGRVATPFAPLVLEESRRLLPAFVQYQTGRELKTLKVMEEVGL